MTLKAASINLVEMLMGFTKRGMIILPAGTISIKNPGIMPEIDIVIEKFIKSTIIIIIILIITGHIGIKGPSSDSN
jgi:hypothetical protein